VDLRFVAESGFLARYGQAVVRPRRGDRIVYEVRASCPRRYRESEHGKDRACERSGEYQNPAHGTSLCYRIWIDCGT
jgi:hypothetical protein